MRLIDADDLQETISIIQNDNDRPKTKFPEYGTMHFYEIADMVDDQPTIDAIQAVRCRECKYHNKPRLGFCCIHLSRTQADDFCSYGEEK